MRRSSDDRRRRFQAPPHLHARSALVDGWSRIPRANLPARRRLTDCGVAHTSLHPVGAGFHARPARVNGQRYYAAPTLPQPLSHGAARRDSSPFRGAEKWAKVYGDGSSIYHDADTVVLFLPVRGGVLDAPRLRECRGGMVATVRRDQPHPRLIRCTRLCPHPHVFDPAGTARAPFRAARRTHAVLQPTAGRRGRRPLRAVCILRVAAYNVRAQPAHHFIRASEVILQPRPGGRGSPPLRWVGGRRHRRTGDVRCAVRPSVTRKGPAVGPVLFAPECPRAFQACYLSTFLAKLTPSLWRWTSRVTRSARMRLWVNS